MEATQVLLIVIVTILFIILAAIGIQVFIILKELQKSVEKINKMLDDGTFVSGTVVGGISGVSGILAGVKTGLSFLNFFNKNKEEKNGAKE